MGCGASSPAGSSPAASNSDSPSAQASAAPAVTEQTKSDQTDEKVSKAAVGSDAEAKPQEKQEEPDSGSEGEEPPEIVRQSMAKRGGVSAETLTSGSDDWKPPVHDKSLEERNQLADIFQSSQDGKLHMLFGNVKPQTFERILDAMFAKVVLGSWNRRDSRMIFTSKDHKPDLPEEKARLEAAGSEVREIEPGNCRIYRAGTNFPGLTMSRAFGDTACEGVLREPEYHKFLMQPADQWYAIIASDGIWEFFEGEEVCNLSAKKLRLKGPRETNEFLVGASRKRWAHVCGDYCDDITSILVQWNSGDAPKDAGCNHQLTVSVKEGMT